MKDTKETDGKETPVRSHGGMNRGGSVFNLGLPTLLTVLLFSFVLLSPQKGEMLAMLGALAFGFGVAPLLSVALGLVLGIDPFIVFFEVALADLIMVMYPSLNFDLAERIPRLGPWIVKIESRGKKMLSRREWLSRAEFAGLVAFKMIPFEGTGSVVTAAVGRLLGLGPWTVVAAATIGSIARTAIVVWAFYTGMLALQDL